MFNSYRKNLLVITACTEVHFSKEFLKKKEKIFNFQQTNFINYFSTEHASRQKPFKDTLEGEYLCVEAPSHNSRLADN